LESHRPGSENRRLSRVLRTVPIIALFAAAVAGCSGGGVSTTPVSAGGGQPTAAPTAAPSGTSTASPAPTASPTVAPTASPTAAPSSAAIAACAGQTTGATSATASQTLATAGGTLCIPAFGGFGGTIAYPPVSTSVSITFTSSTTNVNNYATLGTATPIFYLGISLSGGTNFGTGASGGGLAASSASIVVGSVYTVYGQATIAGFPLALKPCQTTATAGSGGNGVIGGLGTVLNGAQVPTAATAVLEIEPGSSGSGPC
jgi:hypothetical protein